MRDARRFRQTAVGGRISNDPLRDLYPEGPLEIGWKSPFLHALGLRERGAYSANSFSTLRRSRITLRPISIWRSNSGLDGVIR